MISLNRCAFFLAALLLACGCGGPKTASNLPADKTNLPPETLIARSLEEAKLRTQVHESLFQIAEADWELDQDAGTIVFTSPTGLVATAAVQIAGTYDKADGTWLWGWDNPSLDAKLVAHARLAKEYGAKHKLADLTTRKLSATEEKCWEFAAITCYLGGNQGAYKGVSGDAVVYVTFGEVKVEKAK